MKRYDRLDTPYWRIFKVIVLLPVLLLLLQSCEKLEYSPYEVRLSKSERDINQRNVDKIKALNLSPEDTLRFVLTADTQGFYEDNEAMVDALNQRNDYSFVLLGGDITDFGLLKEFKWVHESLDKLKVPYVSVIGNHDATNNGKQVFEAMYGDFDFSFVVANRKFIFLNTNYLEFDKHAPNLVWLEKELQDAGKYLNVFVISHIPPSSPEFGKEKSDRYGQLIDKYGVSMSIHGHSHSYNYYRMTEDGVQHLDVPTTNKREYIIMSVIGKDVQFERVNF